MGLARDGARGMIVSALEAQALAEQRWRRLGVSSLPALARAAAEFEIGGLADRHDQEGERAAQSPSRFAYLAVFSVLTADLLTGETQKVGEELGGVLRERILGEKERAS